MSELTKDLVVIGSGPGGYVAAVRAAQLGLRVALVEKDERLGGTCLLRGCIPTKAMLHSAGLVDEIRHAGEHGIRTGEVTIDFPQVMKRKGKVVDKSAAGVQYLMKKNKIEVVPGNGRIEGPGRVFVTGAGGARTALATRSILIATGSVPRRIPDVVVDGRRVFTSDELLDIREIPKSLIVLGAGAVGVEFASVFKSLGSDVTVVELMPRFLPIEDEEISKEFERVFRKRGITCLPDTRLVRVETTEGGVRCALEKSGAASAIEASVLLVAVGRAPFTEGLGAREAGVVVNDRGFIPVNEYFQTNVAGVYAIGDVIPSPQLAHVASAEGIVAAEHMAGAPTRPINYRTVPSCTYSSPEVASVGLSEAAARAAGYDVVIGKFPFSASGKARILDVSDGFVKIVSEKRYDEVLGVHILGPHATELIAEAGLMLQTECTVEEVARLMHAHPTLSESVMEAAHGVHGNTIHI